MGFTLFNIITMQNDSDDSLVIEKLKTTFPFLSVKYFESGFRGIIGQVDKDTYFDSYEKDTETLSDEEYEELGEILYSAEDNLSPFSKEFPERKFVFICVDCHGGVCLYSGFTVCNGNIIFSHNEMNQEHIPLLQTLSPDYNEGHFQPFTREFIKQQ